MAAAKRGAEKSASGIVGTVRHNGVAYSAGDEDKLAAKLKEDGVEKVRGAQLAVTGRGSSAASPSAAAAAVASAVGLAGASGVPKVCW